MQYKPLVFDSLRRTAITRAMESGLTYRQVQMMSKHKRPEDHDALRPGVGEPRAERGQLPRRHRGVGREAACHKNRHTSRLDPEGLARALGNVSPSNVSSKFGIFFLLFNAAEVSGG